MEGDIPEENIPEVESAPESPEFHDALERHYRELDRIREPGERLARQKFELLKTKVDAFYEAMDVDPEIKMYDDFKVDKNGHLYFKDNQLTLKGNASRYYKITTLRGKYGPRLVNDLMLDPKTPRRNLAADFMKAEDSTAKAQQEIAMETLTPEGVSAARAHLDEIIQSDLPVRELVSLDERLRTIRGELENNVAKLSEIDEKIAQAQRDGDQHKLRELRDERATRLEIAVQNRESLASQLSRIRETIHKMLYEKTTLADRLAVLFREQGVTIVSILTAFGFIITTIVFALRPTSTFIPKPGPGGHNWVKDHLKALARVLARLAQKAASLLPSIIGSIVSFILNMISRAAGFLAEHVWITVLAIGSAILYHVKPIS